VSFDPLARPRSGLGRAAILVSLLLIGTSLPAQRLIVTPVLPTSDDAISLVLPYCLFQTPPTISGHMITLDGFAILPPCPAPPFVPASTLYPLPPLEAGAYTVIYNALGTSETAVFEVTPPASGLFLHQGRFSVTASFRLPGAGGGATSARAIPLSEKAGFFWFIDSSNVELVVKILDGTAVNSHYWVFISSMTDIAFTLTVKDQGAHATGQCKVPGATIDNCFKTYTSAGGTNRNFIDVGSF
jgi:hypothetical protein